MNEVSTPVISSTHGQATVEYILMLATVVVVFSAFMMAFNTDVVHYIFSFIGQLLPGEG